MDTNVWCDLGRVEEFLRTQITGVVIDRTKIAVSRVDGKFGIVSGICNHVGGPLGQGRLDGDYLVCPWHHWKFHRITEKGEPGFDDDVVPSYDFRIEGGHLVDYGQTYHATP